MTMKGLLKKWAKLVIQFRWIMITGWIMLLIIGGSFAGQLGNMLTGGGWGVPGSGSYRAYELMADEFEARSATSLTFVMNHEVHEVSSAEYRAALSKVADFLSQEEEVERVYTLLQASDEMSQALVGKDGRTSIGFVELNIDEGFAQKILLDMQRRLSSLMEEQQFTVVILGAPAFWAELNDITQQGLNNAHLYAIPLILVILLLVFRSIVSALTPLVLAIFSIVIALGLLYFVALYVELSVFALDAAMMIGIGIGIDFSLIYVMRFKEELKKGVDAGAAMITTMHTAGHAIIFSSITVMCSMCAILFVDIAAVRSIALGIIVVVFLLMLTSISLLPAILAVLGAKIHALSLQFLGRKSPPRPEGRWYRLAHLVMRRPFIYVSGSALFLIVIAWPALQLQVGTPDSRILGEDTYVRQGTALLQEGFGAGVASPIHVIVQSHHEPMTNEAHLTRIQNLQDEIQALSHVVETTSILSYFPGMDLESVAELLAEHREQLPDDVQMMIKRSLSLEDDVIVIDVITNDFAASETNKRIVAQIREIASRLEAEQHDLTIVVGGETAEGIDTSASLEDSLWTVALLTLAFLFIVLIVTFRSIVLPLKAILLNLLSLGATYGILVALFQWGWGAKVFGFSDVGFMQSFVPILLLGLLFSLSTDYEVFLLSRVQEEYHNGHTNEESVSLGLEKTAPMISGAAFIMVAVFASFAFAGVLPMQQLGLGMAAAIALDATLVRLILVPASMKLLGKWNWWLPFQTDRVTAVSK